MISDLYGDILEKEFKFTDSPDKNIMEIRFSINEYYSKDNIN